MALTTTIRRSIVRAAIPSLFRQGYSASAGLKWLQGQGVGLRRKDFLAEWRDIAGLEKMEKVMRFVPRKFEPPDALMVMTTKKIKREYQYVFKTKVRDIETGEVYDKTTSILYDEKRTISEASEQALTDIEATARQYFDDLGIEIVGTPVLYGVSRRVF